MNQSKKKFSTTYLFLWSYLRFTSLWILISVSVDWLVAVVGLCHFFWKGWEVTLPPCRTTCFGIDRPFQTPSLQDLNVWAAEILPLFLSLSLSLSTAPSLSICLSISLSIQSLIFLFISRCCIFSQVQYMINTIFHQGYLHALLIHKILPYFLITILLSRSWCIS